MRWKSESLARGWKVGGSYHLSYYKVIKNVVYFNLQIVRKERPLYIQTANCVEEKDWVDLLSKICDNNLRRLESFHPCAFISGEWTW